MVCQVTLILVRVDRLFMRRSAYAITGASVRREKLSCTWGWVAADVSRLFYLRQQRHDELLMLTFLLKLVVELVTSLLIDELSGSIRNRLSSFFRVRRVQRGPKIKPLLWRMQQRNRNRVLHKVHTPSIEKT